LGGYEYEARIIGVRMPTEKQVMDALSKVMDPGIKPEPG
jgi:metal-sulfur cluster biosynthetic enzyme